MTDEAVKQHQNYSYLPIVGEIDDKTANLPLGASKWMQFRHHGTTRRLSHVLGSILVAVVFLIIINAAMKQQNIKCTTFEDCIKVKRLNTAIIGGRSLLNIAVVVVLLFTILSQLGINPFTLFATAGVLGIVIGFGAQSLIKSAFAGIQIMSSGRFSIGDLVEFELTGNSTAKGIVIGFSLPSTTLQHLSGARYFIANGDILMITNFSQNEQRAQIEVSISHATNVNAVLEHLQKLTIEMAKADVLLDKVIQPPVVKGVTATGPHSYTVTISAIVIPTAELYVERYMRQHVLALLHSINVKASSSFKYVSASAENEVLQPPVYTKHTTPPTYESLSQKLAAQKESDDNDAFPNMNLEP